MDYELAICAFVKKNKQNKTKKDLFISLNYICAQKLSFLIIQHNNVTDCILDTNKYSMQLSGWRIHVFVKFYKHSWKAWKVDKSVQWWDTSGLQQIY